MNIFVGKLIKDNGDKVILEVGKMDTASFDVQEGDQFFTLAFLDKDGNKLVPYDPFKKDIQ